MATIEGRVLDKNHGFMKFIINNQYDRDNFDKEQRLKSRRRLSDSDKQCSAATAIVDSSSFKTSSLLFQRHNINEQRSYEENVNLKEYGISNEKGLGRKKIDFSKLENNESNVISGDTTDYQQHHNKLDGHNETYNEYEHCHGHDDDDDKNDINNYDGNEITEEDRINKRENTYKYNNLDHVPIKLGKVGLLCPDASILDMHLVFILFL